MSASERLRALDGAIEGIRPDWDAPDEVEPLIAALPLIADVVEAAERAQWQDWQVHPDSPQGKLKASVAALREHLEGGDERLVMPEHPEEPHPFKADASDTPFDKPRMQQIGKDE